MKKLTLNNDRQQMEALYILLHMGNTESLMRALQLPLYLRYAHKINHSLLECFRIGGTNKE